MPRERDVPYIWVTWLASLLSGDNHCEWAAWFRAHFYHEKRPSTFDEVKWRAGHAAMLRSRVDSLRQEKYQVFIEAQNRFNLRGRVATVGGTPDVVAVGQDDAWVIDCKTGQQRDSHQFQVLIYMLMLPLTHAACRGRLLGGEIQYQDYSVLIMPDRLTDRLKGQIQAMIERVAGKEALIKVPSPSECIYCPVAKGDCPERIDGPPQEHSPEHNLF
jgi:hypothetical protein